MAERDFTDEQIRAMLRGVYERQGRWPDLNPAVEIAGMGEQVGLNRNESYDLLKHLLDEDLISTRFLRAGNDPRLGQEVGQRHLVWDGKEVRLGHDLKLTTTGRSKAGVE